MSDKEIEILLRIRRMTEVEQEYFEMSDYIDYAKSQSKNTITINDDLDNNILEKLIINKNVKCEKKRRNLCLLFLATHTRISSHLITSELILLWTYHK